jgi:hypothetical protein
VSKRLQTAPLVFDGAGDSRFIVRFHQWQRNDFGARQDFRDVDILQNESFIVLDVYEFAAAHIDPFDAVLTADPI